jgi:uncharacterized protein YbjT (DUF2867 family)
VRAVVREPDAHRERMPAGAQLVAGDVTDAASVAAALQGAHGAIFAAATSSFWGADAVDNQVCPASLQLRVHARTHAHR